MTDDLLSLDAVAYRPPFPNPAPTDVVGELAWLDLGDLYIDPKYQRPIGPKGEKNIRQVIENFSWNLFSPLVVARREGGRYAVIDGQHRAIAARTHGGIEKVPCLIIAGDGPEEARAFAVINGAVTAVSPLNIWAARLVAGDVDAIMIRNSLDRVGVRVLRSPRSNGDQGVGETISIDAIEKAWRKGGKEPFELALRTIVETGKGNPGYLRGPMIRSTVDVLARHPEWVERPVDVLNAVRTVGIPYLHGLGEKGQHEGKTFFGAYGTALEKLLTEKLL